MIMSSCNLALQGLCCSLWHSYSRTANLPGKAHASPKLKSLVMYVMICACVGGRQLFRSTLHLHLHAGQQLLRSIGYHKSASVMYLMYLPQFLSRPL